MRKQKAADVRPKMTRICLTITDELNQAIEEARKPPTPNPNKLKGKEFGTFVEDALRSNRSVKEAAKKLELTFKKRPTVGRPSNPEGQAKK